MLELMRVRYGGQLPIPGSTTVDVAAVDSTSTGDDLERRQWREVMDQLVRSPILATTFLAYYKVDVFDQVLRRVGLLEAREAHVTEVADDLINHKQAADLMGCDPRTIERRLDDGVLTAYGVGRKISKAELLQKRDQVVLRRGRPT